MAAAARQAVPFLAARVRPVPVIAQEQLNRLIADLGSDQFATRDQASRELEELADSVEDDLRQVVPNIASAEVRRRLEVVLKQVEQCMPPPRQLHSLRALEVLEHAGTPEARKLLAKLADGAPAARLTREAKEALKRLTGAGPQP